MVRSAVIAAILVLGRQAAASPDPETGVHWFGMTTTEEVLPGIGLGGELVVGGNAIALDASVVGVPICFGRCVLVYASGVSVAYRRQVTERFFLGLRGAARYWDGLGEGSGDWMGWEKCGYLEAGTRRRSGAWLVTAAVAAGAAVWPDHSHSPAFALRISVGR